MLDARNDIFELNPDDFENAEVKNAYIRTSNAEWIGFVDHAVTDKEEVGQILMENPFLMEYDVILFGGEVPEGEIGPLDLLEYPWSIIYALCFRQNLLVQTGSFNLLLKGNNNYEFLLRLAEKGKVFAVSCNAKKNLHFDPVTMAYVTRRHMEKLKESGKLNEIFLRMIQLAGHFGVAEAFNKVLGCFLTEAEQYEKVVRNTAPCLVLVGNGICCGVLAGFANSLADELVSLGQAVITTDGRYGDYNGMSANEFFSRHYKAVIGFQAYALKTEKYQNMKGKKIQFWFDNPIFFDDFWDKFSEQTYILCQDAYYAEFIREYYDIKNAMQFPPGGTVMKELPNKKIYEVVFIGSYIPMPECVYEDEFEKGFFEYMTLHPDSTFEQGIYDYGKMLGSEYSKSEILFQLQKVKNVCGDIIHRDRHCVMEKILCADIQVHVFSETWEEYMGRGRENLIIHSEVMVDEALHIWAQSKIGLNIMRGHKAGMTERIANIMLCGTCCLSDETVYLKEHFCDGKDIVLFRRNELDSLPEKIRYLLEHDDERERIALAGQKKALKEHTWRKRAEQLLEILDI